MQHCIDRSLAVNQLASELHVSQSQLKRLFHHYALTGVHEYFLKLKMNHAKVLLSRGESVRNTALAVGFDNQNNFSTAFKRETGLPPSKWEEQL